MDNNSDFLGSMATHPIGDSESVFDYNLAARRRAALTLRVPDSGDECIDAMIRQANRRDAAVAAMQGLLAGDDGGCYYKSDGAPCIGVKEVQDAIAQLSVGYADALIAKLEEGK